MSKTTNLYKVAGIEDVARFYRDRFFTGGVLDARYFDPVNRFDIRFARTMWVYDNVRRESKVLDLGCGEGLLALLKRKNVRLTGVDLSTELLAVAERNGYDDVFAASLTSLPFSDASFDYVVSLDVMGHVAFEDKDAVLAEMRRVLKPGGVTLNGIEVMNRELHKDYREMTEAELRSFVQIDGHIGLESEAETEARFRRFFEHVQAEPRYALSLSADEILKQAQEYGVPFDKELLEYLCGLSYKERRAFDIAMGYVFARISDLNIKLPPSGLYMLLKASAAPLGPFYNEHRESDYSIVGNEEASGERICLDRDGRAHFDEGWYGANYLPPVARWMGERARVRFQTATLSKISFDLVTHMPDVWRRALPVELRLNGALICAFSLFRYGWLEVEIGVPEELASAASDGFFEFEILAGRTWQPSATHQGSTDDRELSVAVCNIEICR